MRQCVTTQEGKGYVLNVTISASTRASALAECQDFLLPTASYIGPKYPALAQFLPTARPGQRPRVRDTSCDGKGMLGDPFMGKNPRWQGGRGEPIPSGISLSCRSASHRPSQALLQQCAGTSHAGRPGGKQGGVHQDQPHPCCSVVALSGLISSSFLLISFSPRLK